MKQVWIPRVGPPDVLELREAPDPRPGLGEVRIRTRAVGVNFADVMARLGLYPDAPKLPCVVGYEVAGVVDELGAGVTGIVAGARVGAITHFGGYADTVVVPAASAFALPEGLSFETAAALPVNSLTAWLMLIHLANVRAGERVLVHAAAGGVGLTAVQLCRWRGAEVLATASRAKHDRLRAMGVAHCIDYRTEDFEKAVRRITNGRGVDVVLDAVGGASFKKSYRCLAPLGRLFCFGVSSLAPSTTRRLTRVLLTLARMPRFGAIPLMNENRGVFGVNLGHLWENPVLPIALREIVELTANGTLAPVVDRTFPLAEASAAHAYIQARSNFGKVLLAP
jgi:NADPH:quinone reductase-like Zn-dependent oxidoreductase